MAELRVTLTATRAQLPDWAREWGREQGHDQVDEPRWEVEYEFSTGAKGSTMGLSAESVMANVGNRIDEEVRRLEVPQEPVEDEERCVHCGEMRSADEFEDGLRCIHCVEEQDGE